MHGQLDPPIELARRVAPRVREAHNNWEEQPLLVERCGKTALLTLVVLAVLFPMWSVVVTSLASRTTINQVGGMVVIPRELDLSAYVTMFYGGQVSRALWTSVLITVGGTALSLALTVLAAYGLSRPGSLGQRFLLIYFLLTIAFWLYASAVVIDLKKAD